MYLWEQMLYNSIIVQWRGRHLLALNVIWTCGRLHCKTNRILLTREILKSWNDQPKTRRNEPYHRRCIAKEQRKWLREGGYEYLLVRHGDINAQCAWLCTAVPVSLCRSKKKKRLSNREKIDSLTRTSNDRFQTFQPTIQLPECKKIF